MDGLQKKRIPKIISGKDLTGFLMRPLGSEDYKDINFSASGLAVEFSRLKSEKDILKFANKYGLLGLKFDPETHTPSNDIEYLSNLLLIDHYWESIEEWKWHIKHIGKLLDLYHCLTDKIDVEEVIRVNDSDNRIHWEVDSKPTLIFYEPNKHYDNIKQELKYHAWLILKDHIFKVIEKNIHIDFRQIRNDEAALLGFNLEDRKVAKHLIVAIYYDLYRTVNNLERVNRCVVCARSFTSKRKDAESCSDLCRKNKKTK